MRRGALGLVLLGAVATFVALFAIAPAVELFLRSVAGAGGLGSVPRLLADPGNAVPFENSLVQGGLSAVLAVAVGYPAGVFVGRYRWPGRSAVRSFFLLPFLLPSLVMVLGLLDLVGPDGLVSGPFPALAWFAHGLPAILAVNLLYNVPVVVLLTATGCEASSAPLEETVSSLGGSPARAYLEAWARPSWVGAGCGGLLTFVFSALSFAPPILLCGRSCATAEVRVYSLSLVLAEPNVAGVLALVLVAGFALPAALYLVLTRRLRPARGTTYRPRPVPWASPVAWGLAGTFAVVAASEVALLTAVVLRSLFPSGGGSFGEGWTLLFAPSTAARLHVSVAGTVLNTLLFAGAAAGVGVVLAIVSAFVVARWPGASALLGGLLFVPVLLSPVVLAAALAGFWRPLVLGGSADLWLLVILSQALLAAPFALQNLEIPLAGLPPAGREAVETLGASPWGAFVDAELPRVRSGIENGLLFALALGLGEFTATYFLVSSSSSLFTLPVAVYALQQDRLYPAAEAAAALLLVLSLAIFAAIVAGGRRARR